MVFHFPLFGETKLLNSLQCPAAPARPGGLSVCWAAQKPPTPTQGILDMTEDNVWMPRTESIRKVHGCTSAVGELPQNSCYMRGTPHLPWQPPPECCVKSTGGAWEPVPAPAELRDSGPHAAARLLLRVLAVIAIPAIPPWQAYARLCAMSKYALKPISAASSLSFFARRC